MITSFDIEYFLDKAIFSARKGKFYPRPWKLLSKTIEIYQISLIMKNYDTKF